MEKFELSDHCRFICGDAEHLPVASGAYDLVTCCHSFHHYPHQDGAVREMRRVLRPGGRLMLVDGFRDNVIGWFLYDVCVATFERAVHHAAWSALRAMFQQAGLRDVQHRKFNWWAPQILITGMA